MCYECGEVGHLRKNCPKLKVNNINLKNNDNEYVTMVSISQNDKHIGNFKALIDTGASISVIHSNLIPAWATVEKSDSVYFGNSKVDSRGKSLVEIDGHQYEITLLPKEAMCYQVILGREYINNNFELKRKSHNVNNIDTNEINDNTDSELVVKLGKTTIPEVIKDFPIATDIMELKQPMKVPPIKLHFSKNLPESIVQKPFRRSQGEEEDIEKAMQKLEDANLFIYLTRFAPENGSGEAAGLGG
jgi:hypothetical protein